MISNKPTLEFTFLDLGQRYSIPKVVHFIQSYNKIPCILVIQSYFIVDIKRDLIYIPVSVVRTFELVSLRNVGPLRHRTFELKT